MIPRFNFNRTKRPKFLVVFEDPQTQVKMYLDFLKQHVDYELYSSHNVDKDAIIACDAVLLIFRDNAFVYNNPGISVDRKKMLSIAKAAPLHGKPIFIAYRTATTGAYNIYQAEYVLDEVRGIVNPCNDAFVGMSAQIKRHELNKKVLERIDECDPKSEFYEDEKEEEEREIITAVIDQDVRILLLIT